MKKIIARWESKGGKYFYELWDDGTYTTNNGGGNTGLKGLPAIDYMEKNYIKNFKNDFPSVKRIV